MHRALCTLLLLAAVAIGCDRQVPGNPQQETRSVPQERPGDAATQAAATTTPHEDYQESDPVKLTPEAVRRFGIQIQHASRQTLTSTFVAPAKVSLNIEAVAHIGSLVSGRVADAKARVGDSVQKGDVLLIIDSPELGEAQSDFLQKQTVLTVATSALDFAKSGYERAKKLLDESQGIPLTEVQKREAEYKSAQGSLLSAKASVTAAENRLKLLGLTEEFIKGLEKNGIDSRYPIRSPLTGRVIERAVTLGELVRPERDSLLFVADMSTLWVLVEVPEARLADVGMGCKARVTLSASGGAAVEGVVSHISSRLDESTRTASARIVIPGGGLAMPGMFAQAEITASATGEPVLAVPEAAVQMIDGTPNVFVPVKGVENAFVARRIKTGTPVGQMLPVTAGLQAGEPFVSSGSFILKADLGKGAVQEE